jgi:hypothetical protein
VKKEIAMKSFFLSLVVILSFSMVSCLKNSVVVPTAQQSRSNLSIGLSMKDAPADVASIVGILSRQGYDTLMKSFTVIPGDSAECEFDNLAVGSWHLQVNAYNETDTLKYSGSTDVNVVAGRTTPVNLVLDATGSIGVIVTWGGTDTSSTDMALQFDGFSGQVDFPVSSILQPQTVTVEFKARFDSTAQGCIPLLAPTGANVWNTADGYEITYEVDHWCFSLASQSNYGTAIEPTFSLPFGQWLDIACTYDGHYRSIYINGQLLKQDAYSTPIYYGDHGFTLGEIMNTYYSYYPMYFHGAMDELRIWNYARTGEMIDSSMNKKLTGNEPGLVGYWDFNQNSSDKYAIDRTGNGNNGQFVGGVQLIPVSSLNVLTGIDKLHR